jgi:hypothetical protein
MININGVEALGGTELWRAFEDRFLNDHGVPMLGLGQTESGKTEKSYQIGEWLIDHGETWVRFDCGKPKEILPILAFGKPVKIISPPDCQVEVKGYDGDLFFETANTPEQTWDLVEKNVINILSFRAFFLDGTSYGSYVSRVLNSLMNQVCMGDSPIPTPCFLDIDEFSEVAPAYGLIENRHQKEAASKTARVVKKFRGLDIRLVAYDQSWSDIYANTRRAFPFLMICRTPGITGKDIQSLERYSGAFEGLGIDQAFFVWPNRKWIGYWEFPLFPRPPGVTVKYRGQCFIAKRKTKVERWVRELEEEEPATIQAGG